MEKGDPCFAKVKGWIPYPARIDDILPGKSSKKMKCKVTFYETEESNTVTFGNIWPVNPATVNKFVTEKTLSRKYFKDAWTKLKRDNLLDQWGKNDELSRVKVTNSHAVCEEIETLNCEDDDEFTLELNVPPTMENFVGRKVGKGSNPSPPESDKNIDPNEENEEVISVENPELEDDHDENGIIDVESNNNRKKSNKKVSKSSGKSVRL